MKISYALIIAMFAAPGLHAQGWIEPPRNFGDFAVHRESSVISVTVEGRMARIEVEEWFRNDGPRMAEGTYLYPLSGEAAFQSFSLYQGDQELRGETMDADRARAIYEEIVRTRRDPALIELAGNGLIRARVFPINSGERRKITLRYSQLLSRDGDALQLRYVASRPSVPGADRPTRAPEGTVSFTLHAPAAAFGDPFSPTHQIDIDRTRDDLTVRTVGNLDGNLALFLPLATETVGISMVTHRAPGEDGFFMLSLSPAENEGAALPRDVTVVLDVSGSMSGVKIGQARRAVTQVLGTLSRRDRFRLIAFSNGVRQHSASFVEATPANLRRGQDWIDGLSADGGTNIDGALAEAFRLDSPEARIPIVLFLTDGLPTVGVQDPEDIAANVARARGSARVFSFGVGYDVNTYLLDELGTAGRGSTQYVEPGEDIELAVGAIARKISHPVLGDLEIAGSPAELFDIYPETLPDLFSGEELIVFGRFRDDGRGDLTIRGSRNGRVESFSANITLPRESDANGFIPRLWAARKLGWMARQLRQSPNEELREEIRTLALRYGLLSEFTSYLVQEPMDQVAQRAIRPAAGNLPAAAPPRMSADRLSSASGMGAVQASANQGAMRQARSLRELDAAEERFDDSSGDANVRRVFGRVFHLVDDVWTDVALDTTRPLVAIAPYSQAYFDLVRLAPELESILAEFEEVVLAGEEVNLSVREGGRETMDEDAVMRLVQRMRGR